MNSESAKNGILHVTGTIVLNINSAISLLSNSATPEQAELIAMLKHDMKKLQEAIESFDEKTKN